MPYSPTLPAAGPVTPPVIADLWSRLMTDVLGYPRFGAYGGDIGSHVTGFLGARANSCGPPSRRISVGLTRVNEPGIVVACRERQRSSRPGDAGILWSREPALAMASRVPRVTPTPRTRPRQRQAPPLWML